MENPRQTLRPGSRLVAPAIAIAISGVVWGGPAFWRSTRETLMYDATWYGDLSDLRSYLRSGVDPNAVAGEQGFTITHRALQSERADVVELLLSNGGNPDLVGRGDLSISNSLKDKPAIVAILRRDDAGKRLLSDYGVK